MAQLTDDLARLLAGRQPDLMDKRGEFSVLVPLVEGEEGLSLLYEVGPDPAQSAGGDLLPRGPDGGGGDPGGVRPAGDLGGAGHPAPGDSDLGTAGLHRPPGGLSHARRGRENRPGGSGAYAPKPGGGGRDFFRPPGVLLKNPPLDLSYDLVPNPGDDFPYEQAGIPRDYAWRLGRETVPVYRWRDRVIWGLTGRITRNLLGYVRRLARET